MKKRVISILFAVVLLCGLLPIPVEAAGAAGVEIVSIPGAYNGFLGIDGSKATGYRVKSSNGYLAQSESSPYFNEGLAIVAVDGKIGYIDTAGKIIVPIGEGHEQTSYNEGLVPVLNTKADFGSRKYGYADENNTLVIPYQYTSANTFSEGLAYVMKEGGSGYIDTSGNILILYEDTTSAGFSVKDYAYFGEGLAPVRDSNSTNNKWGYINKNGKTVISSLDYSRAFPFSDGLALVVSRSDYKSGFIDTNGKLVIPCIFEVAGAFNDGFALVSDGGIYPNTKYGYIDKSGKVIVPLEYDYASFFNEGYAIAQKGNQWFVLKAAGNKAQSAQSTPSSWAAGYVERATNLQLVHNTLNSAYTQATTRAEFCALAVNLYETLTGNTITERKTFTDSKDDNVEKAAAIGVVAGINAEGTLFNPDSPLTREQAATMLSRLAEAIGKPLPEQAATFADNASISSWATAQVGQVQAAEIMSGIGNNLFSPQESYTREQSIVTILRLYDVLK